MLIIMNKLTFRKRITLDMLCEANEYLLDAKDDDRP